MKIRNYNNQDNSEVTSILIEAGLFDKVWDSEENFRSMIDKNPQSILVATQKGKVIGNVFIIPYGKKVSYLFRLAVKKEFRKQGIGTSLIKRAEKVIRLGGASEIGLYVDSNNINLLDFYKSKGFKISTTTYFYMWKE